MRVKAFIEGLLAKTPPAATRTAFSSWFPAPLSNERNQAPAGMDDSRIRAGNTQGKPGVFFSDRMEGHAKHKQTPQRQRCVTGTQEPPEARTAWQQHKQSGVGVQLRM